MRMYTNLKEKLINSGTNKPLVVGIDGKLSADDDTFGQAYFRLGVYEAEIISGNRYKRKAGHKGGQPTNEFAIVHLKTDWDKKLLVHSKDSAQLNIAYNKIDSLESAIRIISRLRFQSNV